MSHHGTGPGIEVWIDPGTVAVTLTTPERIAEFRSLIEGAINPPEWATEIVEALRNDSQVRQV